MRSHISVHRATTKYFSNSFVFKNKIEKEGLREHGPAGLGAGGPEFKSRRPDRSVLRFSFAVLGATVSVCPPETDLADNTLLA
jgi:hypothetical protein